MKELKPACNEKSSVLKQTCSKKLKICLVKYDLLLSPGNKELDMPNQLLTVFSESINEV